LKGFRIAGKKLSFLDVMQEGKQVQVVCDASKLETFSGVGKNQYLALQHSIQRGDIICKTAMCFH
jgi:lysyl-tRNA synthetase, class II